MRFWDSSAVVPLLIQQDTSSRTATWAGEDDAMVIWTLTPVEVLSALRRLVREGALSEDAARVAETRLAEMDEPSPTDVITFQHGEIVISTETAKRQARKFRTTIANELRLYLVHGLLHLRGFDDETAAGAAEMKRVQEKLVASLA